MCASWTPATEHLPQEPGDQTIESRTWQYSHPTRLHYGDASLAVLRELADGLASGPILVITGRAFAKKQGFLGEITAELATRTVHVFDQVEPEPSHATVMSAARIAEDTGARLVVGLGGGSAMDTAKAVACIAGTGNDITPYMDREVSFSAKQLSTIAIPTTAGTGSEVTPFSVLTNDQTGAKKSLPSPFFYPDVALVVPRFAATAPRKVRGDAGLDALAHAYEAVWNRNSNSVSDALAFRAIKLITGSFTKYYDDPSDPVARDAMVTGATLAGFAFSNTLTAGCHALSYPLCELYKLSHGAACAMTLHLVAEVNKDAVADKLGELAEYLGLPSYNDIPASIFELRKHATTVPTFAELGATDQDLHRIAQGAFQPLLVNNPVPLTEDRIVEMLQPEIRQ